MTSMTLCALVSTCADIRVHIRPGVTTHHDTADAAEGVGDGRVGGIRVEAADGIFEAASEVDLLPGGAFGEGTIGGDVRAVDDGVADAIEPHQGGELDDGFGEIDGWYYDSAGL